MEVGGRSKQPEANRREEKKGMESGGAGEGGERVLKLPAGNLLKPGGQGREQTTELDCK